VHFIKNKLFFIKNGSDGNRTHDDFSTDLKPVALTTRPRYLISLCLCALGYFFFVYGVLLVFYWGFIGVFVL